MHSPKFQEGTSVVGVWALDAAGHWLQLRWVPFQKKFLDIPRHCHSISILIAAWGALSKQTSTGSDWVCVESAPILVWNLCGACNWQKGKHIHQCPFLACFHQKIFWQPWGSSLCHWDMDLYRWVVGLGSVYTFSSYLPIRWYEDRVNETMMCRTRMLPTCDSGHVIHIDETCKLQWKSSLPSLECNRFVSVWLCATYCAQSQISGRDLCRWGVGLRCGWALVAAKMSPIPEEVPGHSETLSQH